MLLVSLALELVGLELGGLDVILQSGDLILQRASFAFEIVFLSRALLARGHGFVFLQQPLFQARRSGQHSRRAYIDVHQFHAMAGQQELANLIRMRHPSRLHHVHGSIPLTVLLDVTQQKPCVDHRSKVRVLDIESGGVGSETGEQRGDAVRLQEIDDPHDHGLDFAFVSRSM